MDNTKMLFDGSHEYRILVPANKEFEERLYRGEVCDDGVISEGYEQWEFFEDTYIYLEDRLFDFINVKFGLLINMYEEETLENEIIPGVIALTEQLKLESTEEHFVDLATKFVEMLKLAQQRNTVVGFFF